ncbi:hypothetical protein [Neobacillus driksii]|uniref:hypothetical protein n=1 Tax=Neobacillus driksii TaxID=3035913 RepID=UPI0035BC408E
MALWSEQNSLLIGPFVYLYLLLWIVLSIMGYLYKIVPFLWWTYKYSKEIGKKSVPSLKDMMNEKIVVPLFSLIVLAVVLVFFSIILESILIFNIGQFVLSLVFILISISILKVLKK